MKTYNLSAPYWINGHKNINGTAIVDEINKTLNDADRTTELRDYERALDGLGADVDLYGITITSHQGSA